MFVGETYAWEYQPQKKTATGVTLKKVERTNDKNKKKMGSANPLEYGLARDIHELKQAYSLKLLPVEKINNVRTIPLELIPIGGQDYGAGTLIFWVDDKTWLPLQMCEFKSNGEIVETHTFSEIKLNGRISDKVFKFKPPDDVEVHIL